MTTGALSKHRSVDRLTLNVFGDERILEITIGAGIHRHLFLAAQWPKIGPILRSCFRSDAAQGKELRVLLINGREVGRGGV
jgi:hypothetical protein